MGRSRLPIVAEIHVQFAWANQLCRDDEVLRAIVLFSMNMFSNICAL